ncbi:MAG TPA: PAS domain-containing protein, partial [Fibrobacteria bacterium]|nr:PAS domain-containing protein [Fibrobacteria bacterium]
MSGVLESDKTFQFRFVPERRADGAVAGVVGIGRDLTAQVEAEAGQARFRLRFEMTFQNSHHGKALVDRQGRGTRFNPALCEMFGYPEQELLELGLEALVEGKDRPSFRRLLRT